MKDKKILRIITILTVLVIWGHSMLPADTSSNESGWLMGLLIPIWNGIGLGRHIPLTDHIVRKVFGHFAEYTVLGLELGGLSDGFDGKFNIKLINAFICGGIVAFIDESIQMISEGRGPAIADMWIDIAGVAVGMIIVKLILKIKSKQ